MKKLEAEVEFHPGDDAYIIYAREVVKVRVRNVIARFYDIGDRIDSNHEYIVVAETLSIRETLEGVHEKRLFETKADAQKFLDYYIKACEKVKEFEKHMERE